MSGPEGSSIKKDTICAMRLLWWSAIKLCQQLICFELVCATNHKKNEHIARFFINFKGNLIFDIDN